MRGGLLADLWLLGGGLAFGMAAGVAAGAYVASKPRSAAARLIETVAMFFLCAPVYVTGLSVLLLFGAGIAASGIGVVPLEYVALGDDPLGWLGSMIVPWIILGLPLADFPVIQGTVIAAALLVAIATVAVDFAHAWLDPRTRAAAATP